MITTTVTLLPKATANQSGVINKIILTTIGQGVKGDKGDPGNAGAWLFGAGIPANTLGVDDEIYYATDTGDVYQKVAGAWVLQFKITGQDSGKVSAIADAIIGGNRVVIKTATGVDYADNTDETHSGRVLGITNNAAIAGVTLTVTSSGEVDGFVGLTVDDPVYLSTNGLITQTVPTSGFIQQLGVAMSATKVYVNLFTPIHLI